MPPHIHASIGEHEVLISIKEVNIMKGSLPKAQLRKAINFIKNNQNELLEAFYALNPEIKKL